MKSIKILSGKLKNRVIAFADSPHLRPPSHFMRQSVFNIVLHRFFAHRMGSHSPFSGMTVLDLFAGTGSYGIEALSRGADHVTFVENHKLTAHGLEATLAGYDLAQCSRVLCHSFPCEIPALKGARSTFDLIFADPPYTYTADQLEAVLRDVPDLLSEKGVFVLEYPHSVRSSGLHTSFARTKGKKRISFLTHLISCNINP